MKTMIVKSETASDDRQAAFTIMQECAIDPHLAKIEWYSNIANLVAILENRFDVVEAILKRREVEFSRATSACHKAADRARHVEIELANRKSQVDEIEAWMKSEIKAKKKQKPNKDQTKKKGDKA